MAEVALVLDPANDSQSTLKFLNSLRELKELRSQIQNAAEYCESSFKHSPAHDKKTVMEETREYICRAVVALVDHLGCVSANLGSTINHTDRLTEAHLRITCLKQRVVLHSEYNSRVALSRRLVLPPPAHFSRYIKPQEHPTQLEGCLSSKKKQQHTIQEDLPLFLYTNTIPLTKSPSIKDALQLYTLQSLTSVLPVHDTKRPAFHFQMVRKHGRRIMQWRIQDNDILSLIRRSKKESLKFLNF